MKAPAPDAADIHAAAARLRGRILRTPLEFSRAQSLRHGLDIHYKLECWQPTRSFKVRGAINAVALLDRAKRERGLVTASAGNHGQAVALAALEFGAPATIFVPADAPDAKKRRIRALGATLDESAADYDEAERIAAEFARERGLEFVHAFSDDAVVAGQGTVGLEIMEDLPAVRTVVLPVGGGGLIAGVGTYLKTIAPGVRVIGVQSVETRVMHASLAAGRVVELPVTPTLADGLAGGIDVRSFERVRRFSDEVILVEEAAIADAVRTMWREDGIAVEGSAATVVAALPLLRERIEGPVAAVISGANIDAARLAGLLARS